MFSGQVLPQKGDTLFPHTNKNPPVVRVRGVDVSTAPGRAALLAVLPAAKQFYAKQAHNYSLSVLSQYTNKLITPGGDVIRVLFSGPDEYVQISIAATAEDISEPDPSLRGIVFRPRAGVATDGWGTPYTDENRPLGTPYNEIGDYFAQSPFVVIPTSAGVVGAAPKRETTKHTHYPSDTSSPEAYGPNALWNNGGSTSFSWASQSVYYRGQRIATVGDPAESSDIVLLVGQVNSQIFAITRTAPSGVSYLRVWGGLRTDGDVSGITLVAEYATAGNVTYAKVEDAMLTTDGKTALILIPETASDNELPPYVEGVSCALDTTTEGTLAAQFSQRFYVAPGTTYSSPVQTYPTVNDSVTTLHIPNPTIPDDVGELWQEWDTEQSSGEYVDPIVFTTVVGAVEVDGAIELIYSDVEYKRNKFSYYITESDYWVTRYPAWSSATDPAKITIIQSGNENSVEYKETLRWGNRTHLRRHVRYSTGFDAVEKLTTYATDPDRPWHTRELLSGDFTSKNYYDELTDEPVLVHGGHIEIFHRLSINQSFSSTNHIAGNLTFGQEVTRQTINIDGNETVNEHTVDLKAEGVAHDGVIDAFTGDRGLYQYGNSPGYNEINTPSAVRVLPRNKYDGTLTYRTIAAGTTRTSGKWVQHNGVTFAFIDQDSRPLGPHDYDAPITTPALINRLIYLTGVGDPHAYLGTTDFADLAETLDFEYLSAY